MKEVEAETELVINRLNGSTSGSGMTPQPSRQPVIA